MEGPVIKDFKKKAFDLFLEWEKNYRKEAKECDNQALEWVYCPKELREDEKKYRRDIRNALKGQIEFIKYHTALMTMDSGPTKQNLYRIERFLSMQHLIDRYFPNMKAPPITITFWGGSPVCARVHVEKLSDIDFEDSYAHLYFQIIAISNDAYKIWTQKRVENVIQHIKEDMEFDGDEVGIELEDDWGINKPGSHEISLSCSVEGIGVFWNRIRTLKLHFAKS
jgi:hypothetical protein